MFFHHSQRKRLVNAVQAQQVMQLDTYKPYITYVACMRHLTNLLNPQGIRWSLGRCNVEH